MKKSITIFTPTYNRGYIIGKLYASLLRQTCKDFMWLIVDDGSTDNTKSIVDLWQKENKIDILYIWQENKGKMQAHNKAVDMCETELFVCVDSDDYLTDTSIEEIKTIWKRGKNEKLAGIIAKRGINKSEQLGIGEFPASPTSSLGELYKNGFRGDTTLCFKSEVIKKFSFPQIENEKFITESYLYDQIDFAGYKYILYPKILIICEYLSDGYTLNMDKISYQNPVGRMYHEAQNMMYFKVFANKFKAAVRYNQYKIISKHKDVRKFSNLERIMLIVSYPVGMLGAHKKKKRIIKDE